jgi:hypothetical protein
MAVKKSQEVQGRVTGKVMVKFEDKEVGKTKQFVAEVTGDGKLAEEGKEQARKGEKEPPLKPSGNLDKLT